MPTRARNYRPWGFKLNLMYSSIPPRCFRNLHNFQEFDGPRLDVGLLSAALDEHPIYGNNGDLIPLHANDFYVARRDELLPLLARTLTEAGVVAREADLVFAKGASFVHPSRAVPAANLDPSKLSVLFAIYWQDDAPGTAESPGVAFLRVLTGRPIPSEDGRVAHWSYDEVRIARSDATHLYRPFIFAPLFVAYFPRYTELDFDQDDPVHQPVYEAHVRHFQVSPGLERPFEQFVGREGISAPDATGRFTISWDGAVVNRSIVASQSYYDWDDDLQSGHGDALLSRDLQVLARRVAALEGASGAKGHAGKAPGPTPRRTKSARRR
jgi:hypothetical protein